jgi:cytoskeleton protein RodZ
LYALEESWADIRDAGQNKLLYETVAAGRVVMLEGAPPLTVFLGNADGVRLEFNGRPYDVSRHKRGQIARFTLNAPETDAN